MDVRIEHVYYKSWWRSVLSKVLKRIRPLDRLLVKLGLTVYGAKKVKVGLQMQPFGDPDRLDAQVDGVLFEYHVRSGKINTQRFEKGKHGDIVAYDIKAVCTSSDPVKIPPTKSNRHVQQSRGRSRPDRWSGQ